MGLTSGPYRFGTFRFDPPSGELADLPSGRVTRLPPQVAALLVVLLDRAGDVVSRSELQARLWPDTTVEFDDGLNFAVRQLRVALGDDATAPGYIETLPRRGYRFVAAVSSSAEPARETDAVEQPARRRRLMSVVPIATVAVALLVVFAVARARRDAPSDAPLTLAVLPFRVDSSDSMMVAYHRRLSDHFAASTRTENGWAIVTDTAAAKYVLSGALERRGFSVEVRVHLVERPERRHLWADSILDSYAFSGNSMLTAERIERSVTRLLSTREPR